MKKCVWMVCVLALVAWGCDEEGSNTQTGTPDTGGVDVGGEDTSTTGQGLTYHANVRPIVEQNCVSCHSEGGIAPDDLNFSSWDGVEPVISFIKTQVGERRMPPFQADESCNDYKESLRLSQEDVETVMQWIAEGALEGDPDTFVARDPLPSDPGLSIISAEPTMNVMQAEPYTVNLERVDDYRCQVVDPGFTDVRWLQGYEVQVDNAAILHHLIIYAVPPGNDDAIANLEAEDELPGWECFGGPRTPGPSVVSVWAPGSGKTAFPRFSGLAVPQGTKFVVQTHYNMDNAEPEMTDHSSVDLWFMPEGQTPASQGTMVFIGNLPFQIPPGVSGVGSETCDVVYDTFNFDGDEPLAPGLHADEIRKDTSRVGEIGKSGCVQTDFYYSNDVPTKIWGVGPHMHLAGSNIKIEILPVENNNGTLELQESAEDECLTDLPRWDFDWQWLYWLKEPVVAPETGLVRLRCEYDNLAGDSPIIIGDGSGDEMCLGIFYLTTGL